MQTEEPITQISRCWSAPISQNHLMNQYHMGDISLNSQISSVKVSLSRDSETWFRVDARQKKGSLEELFNRL